MWAVIAADQFGITLGNIKLPGEKTDQAGTGSAVDGSSGNAQIESLIVDVGEFFSTRTGLNA